MRMAMLTLLLPLYVVAVAATTFRLGLLLANGTSLQKTRASSR
jgi:hypothetical protein